MNFGVKQPRLKCCIYYFLEVLLGKTKLSPYLDFHIYALCTAMPPIAQGCCEEEMRNLCKLLRKASAHGKSYMSGRYFYYSPSSTY